MTEPLLGSWVPPEGPQLQGTWHETAGEHWGRSARVRTFHPTSESIRTLAEYLRRRQTEVLGRRSVVDVISTLEKLARTWLDDSRPPRSVVVPAVAAITGFSPAMVRHSLDLEQASSRGTHLVRALVQELGSPFVLDGLAANPWLGGRSRAVGPQLVGAWFSANIPGLPHLEVMRSFLVKAACLGKVASGEPVFLAAYARTLHEVDPDLASCLAVIGLDRDDSECRRAWAESVDHVVAYGGKAALDVLRADVPGETPASWHGHLIGFSVLLREALSGEGLADLADRCAYDFSVFDCDACLAPAALFVERGGRVSPDTLAVEVATAMERHARQLPPRVLPPADSARRRGWLDEQRLDGCRIVAAPKGLGYVVLVDPRPGLRGLPPGRIVPVVPIDDAAALVGSLDGLGPLLQCAAVEGSPPRIARLGDSLARTGVTRLTRPGLMGLPSMTWRHDGRPCLGDLVRFCDEETGRPSQGSLLKSLAGAAVLQLRLVKHFGPMAVREKLLG